MLYFCWTFDFVYGCIHIHVYSVILLIVVIKLCFYIGLLQFCEVFLFIPPPPFLFSLLYNF